MLHVLLAAALDAGQLDELVVYLVHRAGAKDDLQLALCLKNALGALGVFQLLLVDLCVVCDDQTQAGGAVCGRHDVVFSADAVQNLLCCVFVIHSALLLCLMLPLSALQGSFGIDLTRGVCYNTALCMTISGKKGKPR